MHQPYGHFVLLRICRKSLNKRAARVILGADTKANSVQLFRKLDWVPFFHEAKVNRLWYTNVCLVTALLICLRC